MPHSGNSWQQLVEGLFEVLPCRGAAISHIPVLDSFGMADDSLTIGCGTPAVDAISH